MSKPPAYIFLKREVKGRSTLIVEALCSGGVKVAYGERPAHSIFRDVDDAIILSRESYCVDLRAIIQDQDELAHVWERRLLWCCGDCS